MIEYFIPSAYAQATTNNSGVESDAVGGLAGVLHYIWTNLDNWIAGIVIVTIFYVIARTSSKAAKTHLLHAKGEAMPENALVLVDRLIMIGIMLVGIVIAGSINGIQLGTVLGAVGLGLGFALKDIIGNMISSVMMLAQKHVSIGDLVEVDGTLGTIMSIDTRVTVLQSLEGQKIVIPNQQMINQSITSYTSNPFRRLEIFTYISWDSDVEQGMNLIREVINQDADILKKPEPMVLLDNIEDESNIAIRVLFWVESNKKWLVVKSNLHHRIIKAFAQVGIQVAYPVRSLTISENIHDSLLNFKHVKEGVVPEEESTVLSDEQVMAAAMSTKDLKKVPYPVELKQPLAEVPVLNQAPGSEAHTEIPLAPNAPKISLDPEIPSNLSQVKPPVNNLPLSPEPAKDNVQAQVSAPTTTIVSSGVGNQ